jgi:hypothetical protein
MSNPLKVKTGQIWRCKSKNYCILIGKKYKDDWWCVYPHCQKSSGKVHRMQNHSFHFYELVEPNKEESYEI